MFNSVLGSKERSKRDRAKENKLAIVYNRAFTGIII